MSNDKKENENPSTSFSIKATMDDFQKSLRSGIHQSVDATNRILATLEMETKKVSRPVVSGLKNVEHEGSYLASQTMRMYERRREFGPHIVLGSAAVVGSLAMLRRGRISAVLSGVLAGGAAYMAVYNPLPLADVPDLIFGRKEP